MKEKIVWETFVDDGYIEQETKITTPGSYNEVKALKWFASLEPDEMLAQITYMYEDRLRGL